MNAQNTQYIYRISPVRPALFTNGPTPDEAQLLNAELFPYRITILSDQIIQANKHLRFTNHE